MHRHDVDRSQFTRRAALLTSGVRQGRDAVSQTSTNHDSGFAIKEALFQLSGVELGFDSG